MWLIVRDKKKCETFFYETEQGDTKCSPICEGSLDDCYACRRQMRSSQRTLTFYSKSSIEYAICLGYHQTHQHTSHKSHRKIDF